MANTNDYKPFATGTGANVLSTASYTALAARLVGFGVGIADPAQVNTVWRQASVVSATFGQFTADYGPSNVVDDGNVGNLESQFVAALRNAVSTTPAPGIPYEGTDTSATANAMYVATTNPTSGALAVGQVFLITKNNQSNTGALTLKNGSNDPKAVVKTDGSTIKTGEWPALGLGLVVVALASDNTTLQFQLLNILSASRHYFGTATTTVGGNASTLQTTLDPPIRTGATNVVLFVPAGVLNGANTTLDFGLGPKSILLNSSGLALGGGEMPTGGNYLAELTYGTDGNLRLLNPVFGTSASVTKLALASNMNVPNGQATKIPLTMTGASTFGTLSNGSFTFTKPGTYAISATTNQNLFLNAASFYQIAGFIYVNGAPSDIVQSFTSYYNSTGTVGGTVSPNGSRVFAVSDVLEAYAAPGNGNAPGIQTTAVAQFSVTITKLS